jgi:hypothetical protein
VASIALLNFEEILLKKSCSKVCLEKLCNPQELHEESFLLQAYFLKITILIVFLMIFIKNPVLGGSR